MKSIVLEFLKNLPESVFEQFNQAFDLYKKLPNKNRSIEGFTNRRGYSEQGLKNLLYDLQKCADITDLEVASPNLVETKKDFSPEMLEKLQTAINALDQNTKNTILLLVKISTQFSESYASSEVMKKYFEESEIIWDKFKSDNPDLFFLDGVLELIDLVDSFAAELSGISIPEELISEINVVLSDESGDDNQDGKLRTEFPFLNTPDCPEILYVVVGKRIATYKKYKELHSRLQESVSGVIELSDEDSLKLTQETEACFRENQELWDELNYFSTNKKLLGKHPLFTEFNAQREVEKMTTELLFNYKNSSATFFTRQQAALEKNKDNADKIAEINRKIADREYMLSLVNAKIGVAK